MSLPRKYSGFTLYEMMVTVAVAGTILSFGVPGFQSFVQNSRAVAHTNDMVTALNLARSEATRRGLPVDLCASTDNSTCSGSTDWSTGWVVRTPAGQLIRTWPARSGGTGMLTGNVAQIQFQARGNLPAGTAPSIALQMPNCAAGTPDSRRNITVQVAGRISVDRVDCI